MDNSPTESTAAALWRFGPDVDVPTVHRSLDEHGVAVVEGFLSEGLVRDVRTEVARLLDGELPSGAKQQFDTVFTRSRKFDYERFDRSAFAAFPRVVDDPRIAGIMAYRRYETDRFPDFVIAQRTVGRFHEAERLPPQYSMHTDGIQAHRFMFYLSDVGPGDGPITIVPGAYPEFKAWRDAKRAAGDRAGRRYHVLEGLDHRGVKMTGPAGTLVTFFTDSPHKAGIVKDGRERVIFRINAGAFAVDAPVPAEASLVDRAAGFLRRAFGGGEDVET